MFVLERLMSGLAPHNCLQCGAEGGLLCEWCLPDALVPIPSRCYLCKTASRDFRVCSGCRRKSKLKHVWVATVYEGVPKTLLYSYKFGRAQAASDTIASTMLHALPILPRETIIVPVPSSTNRVRLRGYDHAVLLAKDLSRHTGLVYIGFLARLGQSRQVGTTRQRRLTQLKDAFVVKRPKSVKGADILLVDDVVTTGGTLEAAANVLKNAGAHSVSAVVYAQKS